MELKNAIRTIKDFPEEGIMFRDITTILQDPELLTQSINEISKRLENIEFDLILGPESRGFIFGMPVAYALKKGFIPVRKEGKLPYDTVKKSYSLEYGESVIEMHIDAIKKGQKVVIIDDLLATGGTCKAIGDLVKELGGTVEAMVFFIELDDLDGRDVLEGYNIESIIHF